MNREEVEYYEKTVGQLKGMHEELSALARKKADAPLSPFKLKLVNTLIERIEAVLGEKYRPYDEFAGFNSDDMPTVSDITLILSQYLECAETMRADNVKQYHAMWFWDIGESLDGAGRIRTSAPKKVGIK